jgi:hypothetical protein
MPVYIYIPRPPVTRIVSPLTYDISGLATASTALAASVAVPARLNGMSACSMPFGTADFCACGMPSATFSPSAVVMKAPASLAAVNRVWM